MSRHRLLLIGGLAVLVAAIGFGSLGLTAWSGAQAKDPPASPTGAAADAAERARGDLAARLSVSAGTITLVSSQPQTWGDASLGLPEPGMMYAQVRTEGYIVTLSQGGKTYVYHVAGQLIKLRPPAQ